MILFTPIRTKFATNSCMKQRNLKVAATHLFQFGSFIINLWLKRFSVNSALMDACWKMAGTAGAGQG
jgi:hypothetical protein